MLRKMETLIFLISSNILQNNFFFKLRFLYYYIMQSLYSTLTAIACTCNIRTQCNPLVALSQWHSYFRWFQRQRKHLVEIWHRTPTPSKTWMETLSGTSFRRLIESANVICHVTPDVMGEDKLLCTAYI